MEKQDKTLVINLPDLLRPIWSNILKIIVVGIIGAIISFLFFEKANNTIKASNYLLFDEITYDIINSEFGIDLLTEFYRYSENEILEVSIVETVGSSCQECPMFGEFVISGSNKSNLRIAASIYTDSPEIAISTFDEILKAIRSNFSRKIFNKYVYKLDVAQRKEGIKNSSLEDLLNASESRPNVQFVFNHSDAMYTQGISTKEFLKEYIDFENPTNLFIDDIESVSATKISILGSGYNYFPTLGFILGTFLAIAQ